MSISGPVREKTSLGEESKIQWNKGSLDGRRDGGVSYDRFDSLDASVAQAERKEKQKCNRHAKEERIIRK